jgi:hypothetical protein
MMFMVRVFFLDDFPRFLRDDIPDFDVMITSAFTTAYGRYITDNYDLP